MMRRLACPAMAAALIAVAPVPAAAQNAPATASAVAPTREQPAATTLGDDRQARAWAARAGIDPARVRARTITLNHDGGRWLSLGLPGELPAVVQQMDGRWQRK